MKRRQVLGLAAASLAAPFVSRAQARLPVVGFLIPVPKPTPEALAEGIARSPLLARLRELGWVEGKTFITEREYAGPTMEGLSEAAMRLVAKKADVIWALGPPAAAAAARATKSIPIVFWQVGFPVQMGLIDSFARPGRNATGVSWFAGEGVYLKPAQILRELVPKARRMISLGAQATDPAVSGGLADLTSFRAGVTTGMRDLGFEFQRIEMPNEAAFEPSLAAIEKWGPDCLRVLNVALTVRFRKQIVEFARRHRLPDVHETREWTEAGGLVSYGIVLLPTQLRTAEMLDRILRGAKPADIPVEMPAQYELVLNLKTARALELKVPQAVLARADRVIE